VPLQIEVRRLAYQLPGMCRHATAHAAPLRGPSAQNAATA
jgi:hypothetical protein